jgi:arginyl-tRNA synthetase
MTNDNNEGEKGPSKGELKRLAKKAKNDAKKEAKKGKGAADAPNNTSKDAKKATAAPSPPTPPQVKYYLSNASTDGCVASKKAAIASVAFGVKLTRAPAASASTSMSSMFTGPTLYAKSNPSNVSFGGNGIIKALCLIGTTARDNGEADILDEWLELERTKLRPSSKPKLKKAALTKLEEALGGTAGFFIMGNGLSVADIAIVVTLSSQSDTYSETIQAYLDMHMSSPTFVNGTKLLSKLVPTPPFDIDNNPSMLGAVNSIFATALAAALPDVADELEGNVVEKCKAIKFGDYQCKEAMPLFAKLKARQALPAGIQSPPELAQAIVKCIPDNNPVLEQVKINGPGFILCRVKASYLELHLNRFMNSATPGNDPQVPISANVSGKGDTVVVDFSSPNIAKEMHVGHLRSTIIGESVCRILEFIGADVKRVNHVGDWGTQFGMLITYLREEYPDFGQEGQDVDIGNLTQFYKMAKVSPVHSSTCMHMHMQRWKHFYRFGLGCIVSNTLSLHLRSELSQERFDADADFKKTSQLNVVSLQAGDPGCRAIWQKLCDISRMEFEKVYKRLDITVEECGESFYNDKIPPVIKEFEAAGLISVEEGGAKCVWVRPKFEIPLMLQKSDGGFGYDSTDMAALKYRLQGLGAKRIVCITDFSQGQHFHMCFGAARKIGWVKENDTDIKLEHIGFGTVMGEDGKRFKTRSGETVRLVDLLDEAVDRMEKSLQVRIDEGKAQITSEELSEVAAAMGYGAVKYFDLSRNPTSNYKFSYDKMLDTKGNTAIYLLYAHARLESIITRGQKDHNIDTDALVAKKNVKITLGHPSEINLALHLQMFSDMIDDLVTDLYPYHITDLLYDLSGAVSEFVTKCKVLGSPEMESRLLLCRASAVVMRQCFDLLGIRHVRSI